MNDIHALHSEEASLVLERDPERGLLWRHCGTRVDPGELPAASEVRGPAPFSLNDDIGQPLVPPAGLGWFGPPPVELRGEDGRVIVFAHDSSSVEQDDECLTCAVSDSVAGVRYQLAITLIDGGAFRFTAAISNESDAPITVVSLASLQLPLAACSRRVVSWRGRHNAELNECREPMPEQRWEKVARQGLPGHGGPPGLYVLGDDAGWHSGLALAVQLQWSGDSALAIDRHDEGYWTLSGTASLAPGEIVLSPGESHQAPPALLAISTQGRNGAMAQQHAAIRSMLDWPGGKISPRPVHLNSWEAVYFRHDAERIGELARTGGEIGIERFVLDDGWFKGRRNDMAGLGDWETDPETYPHGLAPLAQNVEAMGQQFGLWVEPEMVNTDSDIFRAHPDWALALEDRDRPTARNQLVLDMRRKDVRDYLFEKLDAVLKSAPIGYLKWDHNRAHAPSGGAAQVRGVYELLARIRAAHPDVEIEGCSAGGGRSDAGMVPFVHRFWTSDNIDAVARVSMQRGFLAFLPPEIMGTHVGASPAHATGRRHALPYRCAIATMGHMGVELDPGTLDEHERTELARWIAFYKHWRDVLHGNATLLGEGPDGLRWQATGTEDHMLLYCIRTTPAKDLRPQPVQLPFASAADAWEVQLLELAEEPAHSFPRATLFHRMKEEPVRFAGSWLAHSGLPMPVQKAESVAIFELKRV